MPIWLESGLVSLFTAVIAGLVTFAIQERKLRADMRTEYMAEAAVRTLLESPKWSKRSFGEIQKRIGGFTADELRKILVRAGAVRFEGKDENELWGLMYKNVKDV